MVAHHPQLQPLAEHCPRCGKPLQDDGEADGAAEQATDVAVPADDPGFPLEAAPEADIDVHATEPADATGTPHEAAPDADIAVQAAEPADATGTPHGAAPGADIDIHTAEPADATEPGDAAAAHATPAQASTGTAPPVLAARPGGRARGRWPLIALLGLLLALQILLADRARLAEDPRWRPVLETLCGTLGFSLPAWDEPAAFTMLDRKVQPAPQQAGALRVDATFRNDARWSQAGRRCRWRCPTPTAASSAAACSSRPSTLGAPPTTLLSPGQSAQVTFVVREPAPGTVAFSFEFR